MLRSAWTDAWNEPGAPQPLPMPLQSVLVGEAQRRIHVASARPQRRTFDRDAWLARRKGRGLDRDRDDED